MHKAIVMTLLAVLSSNAAADWITVASGEDVTAYADPATIRKAGNMVKMWHLVDFKTTRVSSSTGKSFMSTKGQSEFDCKDERRRSIYFSWHSKNMAGGEIVVSQSTIDLWEPVPPGTLNQSLWEYACGKM